MKDSSEYNRQWSEAHKAQLREYEKKRNHSPKRKEREKQRSQDRLAYKREYNKKWFKENGKEYYLKNRDKISQYHKKHDNPEVKLRSHLKFRYGITPEKRNEMLIDQGNRCAICSVLFTNKSLGTKPYVDHCHETGKIRGLLCQKCNFILGCAGDNITVLENAIKYLEND